MDSIHHFVPASPAAEEVIAMLVKSAFFAGATPGSTAPSPAKSSDLSEVVQNELADRLMILAANEDATPEVRSRAWTGVSIVYRRAKAMGSGTGGHIARRIEAFIRDPKQNLPNLKSSGAPAGPPI